MIPFNKPYMTGKELWYISQAHHNGQLSGDGPFTKKCENLINEKLNAQRVLLVHSCTAALEMTAILLNLKPGDEVIMPSYTFVSTANAFVLRGAVPVFIDIREDTLNIDENLIEEAVTDKTRAIVVVHYAGVSCEMDSILEIAAKYKIPVIEDSAQGVGAFYKGKPLGTIGDLGTFSFHETKNITSGEGGALIVNKQQYIERAEILREKGTNRSKFFKGEVDKYTWVDIGSSYITGEVIAAFLYAQLEEQEKINKKRIEIWNYYYKNLIDLERKSFIRCPVIPDCCEHNAHMFYILARDENDRDNLMKYMKSNQVNTVFHYLPLHLSEAGKKYCRYVGNMKNTVEFSNRLLRLPLFTQLEEKDQNRVIDTIRSYFQI